MENNQQSFWQFKDQLRVHTSNMANLSLNESIWSNDYASKRPDDRRNYDVRVGAPVNSLNTLKANAYDLNSVSDGYKVGAANIGNDNSGFGKDFNEFNFGWKNDLNVNGFDDGWKVNNIGVSASRMNMNVGVNGGFNKGIYSNSAVNYPMNANLNASLKGIKNKAETDFGGKGGQRKNESNNSKKNNEGNIEGKSLAQVRFEALSRNETVGGYIFVCNNDTMQENLQRQFFAYSLLDGRLVGSGHMKFDNVNGFDDGWKVNNIGVSASRMNMNVEVNGGFNKGIYSNSAVNYPMNVNLNASLKGIKNKAETDFGGKGGQRKNGSNNGKKNNEGNNEGKSSAEKRFKTHPAAEALSRNETVGGYIFVCSNDTMHENLQGRS